MMKRTAVTLAVMVPAGAFSLFAAVYWLAFAESLRVTIAALRTPARVEARRDA